MGVFSWGWRFPPSLCVGNHVPSKTTSGRALRPSEERKRTRGNEPAHPAVSLPRIPRALRPMQPLPERKRPRSGAHFAPRSRAMRGGGPYKKHDQKDRPLQSRTTFHTSRLSPLPGRVAPTRHHSGSCTRIPPVGGRGEERRKPTRPTRPVSWHVVRRGSPRASSAREALQPSKVRFTRNATSAAVPSTAASPAHAPLYNLGAR